MGKAVGSLQCLQEAKKKSSAFPPLSNWKVIHHPIQLSPSTDKVPPEICSIDILVYTSISCELG